jgi:hypothetical protein
LATLEEGRMETSAEGESGRTSKLIDIGKNAKLCLEFGFGSLIRAKTEIEYRNSIVSVHNGVELLMKIYLMGKNRALIYQKMDYTCLLIDRADTLKEITLPKNTVNFDECQIRLSHFSTLPDQFAVHLKKLDDLRNRCVHFQYYSNHAKVRIILIAHIFDYITLLVREMGLEIELFLNAAIIESLNRLKSSIDSDTKNSLDQKIEIAKSHYFNDLTQQEREDKQRTEDYDTEKHDKIVTCPACQQRALLKLQLQFRAESGSDLTVIRRRLILKELACHYCGLNITEYEELLPEFRNEEASLPDRKIVTNYLDDCPDEDCPDCPDDDCPDCPDDCDCPDCPDDDCPDCPDDCDCPDDDCPDCPDDCPDYR